MTAAAATVGIGVADADAVMERLHRFVYWTDDCISVPGLDTRVGLDPLIGLIPVWGDAIGALVSCYVSYEAYRVGAAHLEDARRHRRRSVRGLRAAHRRPH